MHLKKICVLDYGLGNVRSVSNAVNAVGATALISKRPQEVLDADGLIIPGVGAFPRGMDHLKNEGLVEVIAEFVVSHKPVLGICLGMQMLFKTGMEFEQTQGLGLLPGKVEKLQLLQNDTRLPHIAWQKVEAPNGVSTPMYHGLNEDQMKFYFVHSYAASDVPNEYISGITNYEGCLFVASVQSHNVWGTQFHPEKSGFSGLKVMRNFIDGC